MSLRVECVLDIRARLGECPVWCRRSNSLYWIDIHAPSLNRFDPSTGENRVWMLPEPIGSFALSDDRSTVLVALNRPQPVRPRKRGADPARRSRARSAATTG